MLYQAHLTVISDLTLLNHVQKWFEQFCLQYAKQTAWSDHQRYRLNLALAEGFTNAVRHAHKGLPCETEIKIDLLLWSDRLEILIWDYGFSFDPNILEEPQPGTLRQGGYGWFLLRRLADCVTYERSPDGRNCLKILKYTLVSPGDDKG